MKAKYSLLTLLMYWLLSQSLLFGEYKTFTNPAGVSIEAKLIEFIPSPQGDTVIITVKGHSQNTTVSLDKFSTDDQKKIKLWWKKQKKLRELLLPGSKLEIAFKSNRKRKNLSSSEYSDDYRSTYSPQAIITNKEFEHDYKKNKVRIVCFARHTRYRDSLQVTSVTDETVDFIKRTSIEIDGESYSFSNYESEYSNYESGWQDAGYIIIVRNSKGEITHMKGSKSLYQEKAKNILKYKKGEYYHTDLSNKKSSYSD